MLPSGKQEILFTLQDHDAERAGLHSDVRLVLGDKAFSFATKKELPGPGESITLFEQPLHSASYALSKKVIIPSGQYGAGITTLRYAKRAVLEQKEGYYTVTLKSGEKYLLKKTPGYGEDAWLFKNLTSKEELMPTNKYLGKIMEKAASHSIPKSIRLRRLAENIRSKYLSAMTETPDLKNKVNILRNQVSKVDGLLWNSELWINTWRRQLSY